MSEVVCEQGELWCEAGNIFGCVYFSDMQILNGCHRSQTDTSLISRDSLIFLTSQWAQEFASVQNSIKLARCDYLWSVCASTPDGVVRCAQLAQWAAQVAEAARRFPRWRLGVQVSWENEGGPGQGGVKHWPIAHLNGGIPGANWIAWVPLDGERKEHFSRCPAGKIWLWETSFRTHCLSEGCHSRWVLSKLREQGFEPENQQSLDNIVIGPCLFRGGWKPNWER